MPAIFDESFDRPESLVKVGTNEDETLINNLARPKCIEILPSLCVTD